MHGRAGRGGDGGVNVAVDADVLQGREQPMHKFGNAVCIAARERGFIRQNRIKVIFVDVRVLEDLLFFF